jgi:hypothetical protein
MNFELNCKVGMIFDCKTSLLDELNQVGRGSFCNKMNKKIITFSYKQTFKKIINKKCLIEQVILTSLVH